MPDSTTLSNLQTWIDFAKHERNVATTEGTEDSMIFWSGYISALELASSILKGKVGSCPND